LNYNHLYLGETEILVSNGGVLVIEGYCRCCRPNPSELSGSGIHFSDLLVQNSPGKCSS
jgi:hypothetical protein